MDDQAGNPHRSGRTISNHVYLDTAKAYKVGCLMKCPPLVSRSLRSRPSDAADASCPVAKVVVSLDPLNCNDDFSPQFTMELARTEAGHIPRCYDMDMSTDVIPMAVFSESSQGKISVEGKIFSQFVMKPHDQNLELYGKLCRERTNKYKDVGIKLEEQKDECLSQLKENEMLRNELKQLADQYALSEQQYELKLKQKALELQIADLKMKQYELKLVQEQSQVKVYAEQVSQLLATEKNLRLQLTADGEKFQQFQEALLKSNEVFETFKQEIEEMTKSIDELKKDLKSKTEKSDITLRVS